MTSFKEKKILITGSAQGLGRLLAEEAVKKGAKELYLLDLNAKALEETQESLKGSPCEVKSSQ